MKAVERENRPATEGPGRLPSMSELLASCAAAAAVSTPPKAPASRAVEPVRPGSGPHRPPEQRDAA